MKPYTTILTRPAEQSEILRQQLAPLGVACLMAPVFSVQPHPHDTIALEAAAHDCAAIITTSANALGFLPATARSKALWVVGLASAEKARALGFTDIHHHGANVTDMANALTQHIPANATLLYARGEHVSADMAHLLPGYRITEHTLYTTVPETALPADVVEALLRGDAHSVLFFSTRNLQHFLQLADRQNIGTQARQLTALCFSHAIAEAAERAGLKNPLPATSPTTQSMIASLQAHHVKALENHQHS